LSKKTTSVIINSKNDYLIGVKKNQLGLYKQIEQIFSIAQQHSSSYTTIELNKGRLESRRIVTSNTLDGISKEWKGLKQLVRIERFVKEQSKVKEEIAYFISSKNENAIFYEEGIRSHWSIENTLHWVKDVTLKEDASKIRTGNAPQNISTIKNMSMNLFRINNYSSLPQAMRLFANDINKLYNLIV